MLEIMDTARHAQGFVLSSAGIFVHRHHYPPVHPLLVLWSPVSPPLGIFDVHSRGRPFVRSRLFAPLPPLVCWHNCFCWGGRSRCALWKSVSDGEGYERQESSRLLRVSVPVFILLARERGRQLEHGRQIGESLGSLLFVLSFVSMGAHRENGRWVWEVLEILVCK